MQQQDDSAEPSPKEPPPPPQWWPQYHSAEAYTPYNHEHQQASPFAAAHALTTMDTPGDFASPSANWFPAAPDAHGHYLPPTLPSHSTYHNNMHWSPHGALIAPGPDAHTGYPHDAVNQGTEYDGTSAALNHSTHAPGNWHQHHSPYNASNGHGIVAASFPTVAGTALGLGMNPVESRSTYINSSVYPQYDLAPAIYPPEPSFEPVMPPPAKRRNSRGASGSEVRHAFGSLASPSFHAPSWPDAAHSPHTTGYPQLPPPPSAGPSALLHHTYGYPSARHEPYNNGGDPADSIAAWSRRTLAHSNGSFPSPTPSLALSINSLPSLSQTGGDDSIRASPLSDVAPSPAWRRENFRPLTSHSPGPSASRSLPPSTGPKPRPLPPIVPDIDLAAHPVAAHAREQRARYSFTESPAVSTGSSLQGSPASSGGSSRRASSVKAAPPPRLTPVAAPRKGTKEEELLCCECHTSIGHVILRGKDDELAGGYHSNYRCLECSPHYRPESPPLPAATTKASANSAAEAEEEKAARYETTLSAALDKLEGLDLELDDRRPPARKGATATTTKKRKAETAQDVVICDVCTRDVATGRFVRDHSAGPVSFYVEMICTHCAERYQRCTDCGGGGGPRIGVGRWRSKELFPGGRRTCRLSHVRLGGVNEMTYDIWPIRDLIRQPAFEELMCMCRELFMSSTLATLAIPDMLECAEPLARNYLEAEKCALDGFSMMEPMMRFDVEQEQGFRRYLAIRWSDAAQRKKGEKNPATDEALGNWDAVAKQRPQQLIRKDKTFASYVIGELELSTGSVCIPLSMPKGTGDSYDAATALQQVMLRRMQADLDYTNAERAQQGIAPYPDISEVWAIQMYKKESRIMNRLETQRGLLPLNEYKQRHKAEYDPTHFPPYRQMFQPAEFFAGWRVHARRFSRDSDLTKLSGRSRRKAPKTAAGASTLAGGGDAADSDSKSRSAGQVIKQEGWA